MKRSRDSPPNATLVHSEVTQVFEECTKEMGFLPRVVSLYNYALVISFLWDFVQTATSLGDCRGLVSCMKCDGANTTPCSKCTQLVLRSEKCTSQSCPPGYTSHWSTLMDYMTDVCKERLKAGGFSFSGEVVGALIGIFLCVLTAVTLGLYCKFYKQPRHALSTPPPSLTGTHSSQGSDESGCLEYIKLIAELRPQAPVFLDMLNDTRRQVRNLPSRSALQPYKPVLKDLSRILIILNRPERKLGPPPPDWETLLAWANRVLNRYKKHHSNQVNELVSFLGGGEVYSGGVSQQEAFQISVFDTNYNTRKESLDYSGEWPDSSELDDYFSLGFRPQDEITTEL